MAAVRFASLWTGIRRLPFVSTLAIALLLQVIGEQFPFSSFPMYSGMSDETTVIYVTDGAGKPLPVRGFFRVTAAKLKKVFETKLVSVCKSRGYSDGDATANDRLEAGKYAAAYLVEQVRPAHQKDALEKGLKLMRTTLAMDKKGISESTELVGEWSPPGTALQASPR